MSSDASTAAAISAMGSVGTAVVNSSGKRRSQERANEYNIKQWERQNQYNDPSAQMKRLREAGLNPNMIYGTSPSSAVGTADAPAKMESDFHPMENPVQNITKWSDAKQTEAQTNNLETQNTVLRQEALLKAAQTGKTLAEGASANIKAQIDTELTNTSLEIMKENLRGLEQQTIGGKLDNTLKDQSLKPQLMKLQYEVKNAKATLEGKNLENQLKKFEQELNSYGITKNDNLFFRIMGTIHDKGDAIKDYVKKNDPIYNKFFKNK